MLFEEPPIPITEIQGLQPQRQKQLENCGIKDLTQLYFFKDRLRDANELAVSSGLSIREAIEVRNLGRKYLITLLTEIAKKQKVEPLDLLWKVHWLIGIIPSGQIRKEVLIQEAASLNSVLELLDPQDTTSIDRILVIQLHRLLTTDESRLQNEFEQLIKIAEHFQKKSLFAYKIVKGKASLLELTEKEEPAQTVVALRKITSSWKQLIKVLKTQKNTIGQKVVEALLAADNLKILDLSTQHLQTRLKQTMSSKNLRESRLVHITGLMNAAVELRDAYLVKDFGERASRIWFELAQEQSNQHLTDNLLRSLRFARTAIFHSRALDDLFSTAKLLSHLSHLLKEMPTRAEEVTLEAVTGIMSTIIHTAPLLDRPVDETLLIEFQNRVRQMIDLLKPQLSGKSELYQLIQLYIDFQRTSLRQLEEIGCDAALSREGHRMLIQSILDFTKIAADEERESLLTEAVEHANQILTLVKSKPQVDDEDLQLISLLTAHLAQRSTESLSNAEQQLMTETHQIVEKQYTQIQDSKARAKLALQLLLSKLPLDSTGLVTLTTDLEDNYQLEEYATRAFLEHVKTKEKLKALKAGSMLVELLIQRLNQVKDEKQRQNLITDAYDFTDKTFTFMPSMETLTRETYPFALSLLRNTNDLGLRRETLDAKQWIPLLTQGEQFAHLLASAAKKHGDSATEFLALSYAATATAELANLTTTDSKRTRLLNRATKLIQRAFDKTLITEQPENIKAIINQYNRILGIRVTFAGDIKEQATIFDKANQTLKQAIGSLRKLGAEKSANQVDAHRLLNVEIPQILTQLSDGTLTLDTSKSKITSRLKEIQKIGDKRQVELAKRLERQWAFQLGANTLLLEGFRLETTESGFILADAHFRINLQVEEQITIDNQPIETSAIFPYIRPSKKRDSLLWYEATPVLNRAYRSDNLQVWHTLEEPSSKRILIVLWVVSPNSTNITFTLEVPSAESLHEEPEGITVHVPGGKLHSIKQPTKFEQVQDRGRLIFALSLNPGQPEKLPFEIQLS